MFTVLFVSFLFSLIDATPLVKDSRVHQQVDPDAYKNVVSFSYHIVHQTFIYFKNNM